MVADMATFFALGVMSCFSGWTRGTCGFGMGIAMNAGMLLSTFLIHTLSGNSDWKFPLYKTVCLITAIDTAFIPALTIVCKPTLSDNAFDMTGTISTEIWPVGTSLKNLERRCTTRFISAKKENKESIVVSADPTPLGRWGGVAAGKILPTRAQIPILGWAVFASSISGVTSGFAGVTSPPIQILVLIAGMPKAQFRGTWIAVNSILKPIQLVLLIVCKPEVFDGSQAHYYAAAIACAWCGLLFGNYCHARITEKTARILLLLLLSISSILLLMKAGALIAGFGGTLLGVAATYSLYNRWMVWTCSDETLEKWQSKSYQALQP
eukprot:jgi/Bigna1/142339/aug1.69_g17047